MASKAVAEKVRKRIRSVHPIARQYSVDIVPGVLEAMGVFAVSKGVDFGALTNRTSSPILDSIAASHRSPSAMSMQPTSCRTMFYCTSSCGLVVCQVHYCHGTGDLLVSTGTVNRSRKVKQRDISDSISHLVCHLLHCHQLTQIVVRRLTS